MFSLFYVERTDCQKTRPIQLQSLPQTTIGKYGRPVVMGAPIFSGRGGGGGGARIGQGSAI